MEGITVVRPPEFDGHHDLTSGNWLGKPPGGLMSEVSTDPEAPASERDEASRFVCITSASGVHATWVHVAGELDLATSPQLQHELQEAQDSARLIVIDLRAVTFIDCSGLHVLLAANGGRARAILVAGRAVNRLLQLAGVADQVSTVDLDPSEPDPSLGLGPEDRAGLSAEYGPVAPSGRSRRKTSESWR
jgi:anti-sigma B factor antagonist